MASMTPAELRAYAARNPGLSVPTIAPHKAQQPPARSLPPGVVVFRATLPGEGVSVNEAYANVPGRGRVATVKLKDWKAECERAMRLTRLLYHPHPQPYLLELICYGDWETQEGKARRRDCTNLVKADEDAVCGFIGLDDCWVYRVVVEKRHDPGNPRHLVTLTTL